MAKRTKFTLRLERELRKERAPHFPMRVDSSKGKKGYSRRKAREDARKEISRAMREQG